MSDTDRQLEATDQGTGAARAVSTDPVPVGAVHVTAAIVVRGARVLLARRVRPPELMGLWEFPGGKVEAGEAPEAALTRELVEELGCEVRVEAFVARSEETERNRPIVLDAYRCVLVSGEPRPDALDGTHDRVQWVDAVELAVLSGGGGLAPLDVPLAAAVLEILATVLSDGTPSNAGPTVAGPRGPDPDILGPTAR